MFFVEVLSLMWRWRGERLKFHKYERKYKLQWACSTHFVRTIGCSRPSNIGPANNTFRWKKSHFGKKQLQVSEQGREPTKTLTLTYGVNAGAGMESGRHWWGASALTTAPSLPVKKNYQASSSQHPKFILMKSNSLQFKVIIFTAVQ